MKIHTESILQGSRDLDDPQVLNAVLQSCERYEAIAERLTLLRRWQDASSVTVEHGRLLRLLATQAAQADVSDKELRRVYYMQVRECQRDMVGLLYAFERVSKSYGRSIVCR